MSVNGEAVDGRIAVSMGLADEFAPSSTALLRAVRIAQELISGERRVARRDWAAITAAQMDDLEDLLKDDRIAALMATPQPDGEVAKDLEAARKYTARVAFEAMDFGYRSGFEKGLENDARLFGELAASPSGREWNFPGMKNR